MVQPERQTGIEDLPTGEQLVSSEDGILNRRKIEIPRPPQDLLDVQASLVEKGISIFEAHFLPDVALEQNSQFPGWQIKPENWFWQNIKEGKILGDPAKLPGMWILIDGTPKPNYDRGLQMYPNDPHAPILSDLRGLGKITVPDHVRNVPEASRFGVSLEEIKAEVVPRVAEELLGIDAGRIRVPKEIEFNVIGNLHHPEWGQTNTWEWLHDNFGDDDRLIGGSSDYGGLAHVDDYWPGHHYGLLGFRLLAEFPQK